MLNFAKPEYETTKYGTKRMTLKSRNTWHAKKLFRGVELVKIEIRTQKMMVHTLIVVNRDGISLSSNGTMKFTPELIVEMADSIGEALVLLGALK